MASTTLNTFILPAPEFPVRSVEMKGSWDNFQKAYQLKRDGQTGHWRGCHAFENIVCDGVTLDASASREGGLKMGGTYWYYYILHTIDGELEHHDKDAPKTSSCPLLPGQMLNVLEVPTQANLVAGRNVSSTSIDSLVFTLDPKDKYLPPGVRRAATTSAIKKRKARLSKQLRTVHRAASTPMVVASLPKTSTSSRAGQSTLERQRSLLSVFQRMRQTRSAGSNTKSNLSWPRRLFSRAGQSAKTDSQHEIPEVPKLPFQAPSISVKPTPNEKEPELPIQRPTTARSTNKTSAYSGAPLESTIVSWPQADIPLGEIQSDMPQRLSAMDYDKNPPNLNGPDSLFSSNTFTPVEAQLRNHNSFYIEDTSEIARSSATPREPQFVPFEVSYGDYVEQPTHYDQPLGQQVFDTKSPIIQLSAEEQQQLEHEFYRRRCGYAESSDYSCARSDDFSPYCASNTTHSGPMSPLHLSQPETPVTSEFEDDDLLRIRRDSEPLARPATDLLNVPEVTSPRPPSRAPPPPPPKGRPMTPRSALGGFQGYSLPKDDHASVLTIRKVPSATFKPAENAPPFTQQAGKKNLVHSWDDGSEHLLDDLGYLGELIL